MPTYPSFFHLAMPTAPPAMLTPEEHRASLSPEEEAVFTTQVDALYAALSATISEHCAAHSTSIGACINAAQQLVDTLLAEVFEAAADA